MKSLLKPILVGMIGISSLTAFNSLRAVEVSVGVQVTAQADFYAPLEAQGTWVDVDSYGRCWRPSRVDSAWRPYADGTWVWTDDYGWYWLSDEPWAWACYHYGNWYYDPRYEWIWIPGTRWAPAWVTWRTGGNYIGWAPLPPAGVELRVEASGRAAPFVFVESNHFHERIRPGAVLADNSRALRETKAMDTRSPGTAQAAVNNGPRLEDVQRATAKKIRVAKIEEAVKQTPAPANFRKSKGAPDTKDDNRKNEPVRPAVRPNPETRPNPEARPEVRPDARPNPEGRPPEPGKAPEPRKEPERRPGPDTRQTPDPAIRPVNPDQQPAAPIPREAPFKPGEIHPEPPTPPTPEAPRPSPITRPPGDKDKN